MRTDRDKAIILRKSGKSYQRISKALNVPKSTLTYWFKNVKWSNEIKKRLIIKAKNEARKRMIKISHRAKQERINLYKKCRERAEIEYRIYSKDRLFIAGLMIYWSEGDNNLKNGIIRVTNTDPVMLRLFYFFIKKYLPEIYQKVKVYLILYPDLNEEICKGYWAKRIPISLDKFFKSQYIKGKHPTKRLLNGICTITITSRAFKEIILSWINLIKKKFNNLRA